MAVNASFGTPVILEGNIIELPVTLGANILRLSASHFNVTGISDISIQVVSNSSGDYKLVFTLLDDVQGDITIESDGTVFNTDTNMFDTLTSAIIEFPYDTRIPTVENFDVPGDYTSGEPLYFFWEFSAPASGFNGLNSGTQQFIYEGEEITHFSTPSVFGYTGDNDSKSDFTFPLPADLGNDWETADEDTEYKFIVVRLLPDATASGLVSVTLRDGVIRGPRGETIAMQQQTRGQTSNLRTLFLEPSFTRNYEDTIGNTSGLGVNMGEVHAVIGADPVIYIGTSTNVSELQQVDGENQIRLAQGSFEALYNVVSLHFSSAIRYGFNVELVSGDPSVFIDTAITTVTLIPPSQTIIEPPEIEKVGPLNITVLVPFSIDISITGHVYEESVYVRGLWKRFTHSYNHSTQTITISGTAEELLSDGEWFIGCEGDGGDAEIITVYNFIHQLIIIPTIGTHTIFTDVEVDIPIRIDNIATESELIGLLLGLYWEDASDIPIVGSEETASGVRVKGLLSSQADISMDSSHFDLIAGNTAGVVEAQGTIEISESRPWTFRYDYDASDRRMILTIDDFQGNALPLSTRINFSTANVTGVARSFLMIWDIVGHVTDGILFTGTMISSGVHMQQGTAFSGQHIGLGITYRSFTMQYGVSGFSYETTAGRITEAYPFRLRFSENRGFINVPDLVSGFYTNGSMPILQSPYIFMASGNYSLWDGIGRQCNWGGNNTEGDLVFNFEADSEEIEVVIENFDPTVDSSGTLNFITTP